MIRNGIQNPKKLLAAVGALTLVTLSACGKPGEKEHLPVIVQTQEGLKAVTNEEAEELCKDSECEPNQIYTEEFGGGKKSGGGKAAATPPVTPDPPADPSDSEGQPKEDASYAHKIMNVPTAWNVSQGSRNVVVAVMDGGMQYTHPDLADNVWTNEAEKNGREGVDDDGNGYIDDVHGWDFYNDKPNGWDDSASGHGTHVAGIIGAQKNGIGVVGVSPQVKIMPLKFMGKNGSGSLDAVIKAYEYATKMGARVISNSWGGSYSKFLDQAVATARAAGIVVVASAGNAGDNNDNVGHYPSDYEGVISVGSSDSNDNASSYSNYGKSSVHVFAPGAKIRSTYKNEGYVTKSGTSMAAPQVSGAIALALAVRPNLDEATLKQDLCDSSAKIILTKSICGRMDVGEFIKRVSTR